MQFRTTRNWAIASAVAAMLASSAAGVRAQDATATPPASSPTTAPNNGTVVPDSSATGAAQQPNAAPTTGATSTDSTTTGSMSTGSTTAMPMSNGSMSNGSMSNGSMSNGSMSNGSMSNGSMSNGSMPGMMSGTMTPDYKILSNPNYDYIDLQQAKARGLSDSQIATVAKIAQESGVPFRMVSAAVERGETFPMLATEYNLKLADVYESDKEKMQIANYISTYESIGTKGGTGGGMMMSSGSMSPSMPMSSTPPAMTNPTPMAQTPAPMTPPMANTATLDIVDTAMAAPNLSTLVKALQMAGLVETLKGAGPFTVFAPDNKAFSRLPAGALDALMADPTKLKMVLTYHVIPANIMAADAMAMTTPDSPPTVEGATLKVTKGRKGKLKINDATVTKANIQATNGTIHIIDRVLMPPMDATTPTATPMTPATPDTTAPGTTTAPMTPAPGTTTAPMTPAPGTPDPNAPTAPGTPAAPAPATPDATPPAAPAMPPTPAPAQ